MKWTQLLTVGIFSGGQFQFQFNGELYRRKIATLQRDGGLIVLFLEDCAKQFDGVWYRVAAPDTSAEIEITEESELEQVDDGYIFLPLLNLNECIIFPSGAPSNINWDTVKKVPEPT